MSYNLYSMEAKPMTDDNDNMPSPMFDEPIRWQIANLAKALAAAQAAFPPIPKDKQVTVTSDRGSYKFKYATLDAIRSAVMPSLAEQGLALTQRMVTADSGYAMETMLLHSSGEWLRNLTPMFISGRRTKEGRELPPTNQDLGSAQTFARRYGLTAILCVTADEDDDANTADGNHVESHERVPYRAPANATGTAAGGTDFRPPGPRQSSANGRRMAADEPQLAADRPKGAATGGKKAPDRTEKTQTWVDNAIQTLNLSAQGSDSIKTFWTSNEAQITWIEANFPEQYERVHTAYENALEAAITREG
jgi:hypothetical protein